LGPHFIAAAVVVASVNGDGSDVRRFGSVSVAKLIAHVQELDQHDGGRLAHGSIVRVTGHRHGREPGSTLALAHLPAPAPPGALTAVRHHPFAGLARPLQV